MMAWQLSLKSSVYPLHLGGLTIPCYAAVLALLLNIAVAAGDTADERGQPPTAPTRPFRLSGLSEGRDFPLIWRRTAELCDSARQEGGQQARGRP